MTADPYARLDAAYRLRALDTDERLLLPSGKVAGVVNPMDGRESAVPLDLVNAGGTEI